MSASPETTPAVPDSATPDSATATATAVPGR